MAGRGTDIILGGNAEFMARLKLREMLMPRYNKFFCKGLLISIYILTGFFWLQHSMDFS